MKKILTLVALAGWLLIPAGYIGWRSYTHSPVQANPVQECEAIYGCGQPNNPYRSYYDVEGNYYNGTGKLVKCAAGSYDAGGFCKANPTGCAYGDSIPFELCPKNPSPPPEDPSVNRKGEGK